MAYRIRYEGIDPTPPKKGRPIVLTVLFFVLFLIGVFRYDPEGSAFLQRMVIPGGFQTVQALEAMAENLRDGMPLSDAAVCFCRELIDHDEIR